MFESEAKLITDEREMLRYEKSEECRLIEVGKPVAIYIEARESSESDTSIDENRTHARMSISCSTTRNVAFAYACGLRSVSYLVGSDMTTMRQRRNSCTSAAEICFSVNFVKVSLSHLSDTPF